MLIFVRNLENLTIRMRRWDYAVGIFGETYQYDGCTDGITIFHACTEVQEPPHDLDLSRLCMERTGHTKGAASQVDSQ
jgi:hypothetical protein